MFTEVSTSYPTQTDCIIEIKYDFITQEDKVAFSMGDIKVNEFTIEEYMRDQKKEN